MKSTRENIIHATATLLAQKGLDDLSIRDVCKKAGVKAPTIYHYFNDKEDLLNAVIGQAYEKHTQAFLEGTKNKAPYEALLLTWNSFFDFVKNEPDLFHAIIFAHLRQKIPPEADNLFHEISKLFEIFDQQNLLEIPYREATEIFYACAYGQAMVFLSQAKNPNLERAIGLTRDICLQSLIHVSPAASSELGPKKTLQGQMSRNKEGK